MRKSTAFRKVIPGNTIISVLSPNAKRVSLVLGCANDSGIVTQALALGTSTVDPDGQGALYLFVGQKPTILQREVVGDWITRQLFAYCNPGQQFYLQIIEVIDDGTEITRHPEREGYDPAKPATAPWQDYGSKPASK
jgi:hypothetical protein